ncbi:ATP-dependent RNA helicase RhlB [Terasakiispira papahanaumokuakeensis]|uniref:ATP-dependent RNA helicase RhlB n=1 Tax=Terasakiispira papahanaumokuakeensis TaxID=197479 RepID=A0A1E2V9H2_9GAMM|nr:ATP-dependent RNA helicase RhlB [Terasakiispira papahanaumokuakeensis]
MTEQTTASNSSATQPKRRRRRRGGRRRGGPQRQQTQRQSVDNWSLDQFQVPVAAGKVRFHDFNLPLPLMQAVQAQGFEYCTPIQAQSLHYTLHGVDLIGKAQTGTGKTAAFLISIMTYFLEEEVPDGQKIGAPRALIVAPTRELVMQIAKDAKAMAEFAGLNVVSVVGGMDYQKQRDQLRGEKIDLLVATPGRLLDFHSKRDLDLRQVEVLVLDEADRMLDMGFIPDVKRIIRATPRKEERQTMLFSATFTQDIMNLAEQWTIKPQRIEIASKVNASENIEQHAFLVSDSEKLQLMKNLLKRWSLDRVIIFANRRDITRDLHQALRQDGFNVALLSGEVDQKKRVATLERFRAGKVDVLVATDVAGRGLHIDDISHVINYTLPEDPEDYVHRIGRTGRAGAKGTSISFVGEEDAFAMPAIEQLTKAKLPCVYPPEELAMTEGQFEDRTDALAKDEADKALDASRKALDASAVSEQAELTDKPSEGGDAASLSAQEAPVESASVETVVVETTQSQSEEQVQSEVTAPAAVTPSTDPVTSAERAASVESEAGNEAMVSDTPSTSIEDTSAIREVVQEVNEDGDITGVKVTVEFEVDETEDYTDSDAQTAGTLVLSGAETSSDTEVSPGVEASPGVDASADVERDPNAEVASARPEADIEGSDMPVEADTDERDADLSKVSEATGDAVEDQSAEIDSSDSKRSEDEDSSVTKPSGSSGA